MTANFSISIGCSDRFLVQDLKRIVMQVLSITADTGLFRLISIRASASKACDVRSGIRLVRNRLRIPVAMRTKPIESLGHWFRGAAMTFSFFFNR